MPFLMYEWFNSRVGAQRGASGTNKPTRSFIVLADNTEPQDADPTLAVEGLATLQSGSDSPVPRGSAFPWPSFGAAHATDYRPAARLGFREWLVQVVYTPISIGSPTQSEWKFAYGSASETQEVFQDRNGVLMGVPKYIGVAGQEDGATHQASAGNIMLRYPSGFSQVDVFSPLLPREPKAFQQIKRRTAMTARRRVGDFNPVRASSVASFITDVNAVPFYGIGSGKVQFMDWRASQSQGQLDGQAVEGIVWDVEAVFVIKPEGDADKVSYIHTFADDEGKQSPVTLIGRDEVLTEQRSFYALSDLSGALAAFGA